MTLDRAAAALRCRSRLLWQMLWALCLAACLGWAPARAEGIQLTQMQTERNEEGLLLSFSSRFELTRQVEDALQRGLPIYFQAEVEVFRKRWYWRDARVAQAVRTWRLNWQPLTRQYRVSLEGLHQNFDSLPEALSFMRGASGWRVADIRDVDDPGSYYLEFRYKLDTTQLPRPMQIGLGAPQGWALSVERSLMLGPDLTYRWTP